MECLLLQTNSITVTRDILQINEQQVFELQDPSLGLHSADTIEDIRTAGILNLPPPQQSHRSSTSIVHKETPIILTVKKVTSNQLGRRYHSLGVSRMIVLFSCKSLIDLGMKYSEPQICVQQVNEREYSL
ncbi:hypothetical protein Btru_076184 [Bulinus truncatus]|nr:hypothetical protein Btru_076184 [Bulinus truncatus]